MLAFCVASSSTLNIETISSSETSVDFQWTAWRYVPEDRNIERTLHITEHKILTSDQKIWSKWLYLPPAFTLVSYPVYSSTLKIKVTYASETAVNFQLITRHYTVQCFSTEDAVRIGISFITIFNHT
jgi:hypothetical protein